MQIFAGKIFKNPTEIIQAFDNESFLEAFNKIEILRKQENTYLLGYLRYEAKEIFLGNPIESKFPLLYFEVYDKAGETCVQRKPMSVNLAPKAQIIYPVYRNAIEKIKEEIACGNTYQVNYTYDYKIETKFNGADLYNSILPNQTTPYNAYIKNEYEEILCFSPELFFELENNKIKTKPMKGTVKRGKTEEQDKENIEFLKNDIKNRAENVMIVDLLRNDLGKIAKTGSVKVDKLFEVETHNTLHQMTSEVSAELDETTTLFEIFEAIFPCGSITGAPKINTMKIIDALEVGSRDVYCGALGLISKEKTTFCVPIRTLQRSRVKVKKDFSFSDPRPLRERGFFDARNERPKNWVRGEKYTFPAIPLTLFSDFRRLLLKPKTDLSLKGRGETQPFICRVGGAIVWDSTPEDEWEETLTKIMFLKSHPRHCEERQSPDAAIQDKRFGLLHGVRNDTQKFSLVETFLVKNGELVHKEEHIARMKKSAKELGFKFDSGALRVKLNKAIDAAQEDFILRVLLSRDGALGLQNLPYEPVKNPKISISKTPVSANEKLLYYKTTHRPWYDEAMEKIKSGEVFDEVFFNENGELTEGARSNILLQLGGELFTPSVSCGLLKGVLRQKMLKTGGIKEKKLYLEDLKNAEKVFCINSIRGIVEVEVDFCSAPSPLAGEGRGEG